MTWTDRRRVPVLLAAATLIPIGVLAWLGVWILRQDNNLDRQRQREELQVAAGRLALDIERRLQGLEETPDSAATGHPVPIRLTATGLASSAGAAILYQPAEAAGVVETIAAAGPPAAPLLADAEAAEFQRHDLAGAARLYRALAASTASSLRAQALVGLGRTLRQAGDRAGALQAYADLEALNFVLVAGQPSGLVARQGRCKVLEEAHDADGLRRAALDLASALTTADWPIDRSTFGLYRDMLEGWGVWAPVPQTVIDAVDRAEGAAQLWRLWRRGDLESRGRRVVWNDSHPVLAMWAGGPDAPHAVFLTSSELEAMIRPLAVAQQLVASMSNVDGRSILGSLPLDAASVSLTPADTRLPFILRAASNGPASQGSAPRRRTVLISGLLLAFVLMLAAAYALYRTTTRELGLARQQTDFVSAVSHEFRTPLTSMRHLTDLLVSRGVTSEERRTQYYELLAHETERLQRMVETLLSFGRIEAGAYAWQLEPVDAAQLVQASVTDFRREPIARGREITYEIDDSLPAIRADGEALGRALWNLLENAAKYSDTDRPIRVFARHQNGSVVLGVSDEGVGIPPEEREHIFRKFVRGADAKRAGIRGIGVGLALVSLIVEAHGGSVHLDSEPGRGSLFTMVLPTRTQ